MSGKSFILQFVISILLPSILFSQDLCDPDSIAAEVSADSVLVYHFDAEYNCCPHLDFLIEQEDTIIHIEERDTLPICECDCCFDLTIVLKGLASGTYRIKVWDWGRNELYGETRITIGGSGQGAYLAGFDRTECKTGGIEEEPEKIPGSHIELMQNNPNPFNPHTELVVIVPYGSEQDLILRIYDSRGRVVSVLYEGAISPGRHVFAWDGRDKSGRKLPSGVYFSVVETPSSRAVRKMVMMK
ncbi:MAG: FlgD immunoglobulin-like domain containing protein [Candidatus Glassbacteria bacterium]